MKFPPLLILSGALALAAAPSAHAVDNVVDNTVINPASGAATLTLRGQASPEGAGFTITHNEDTGPGGLSAPISVGKFWLRRPHGFYQWNFTEAGGTTVRPAMEINDDHSLLLHSSVAADRAHAGTLADPELNAIELRPGPDGGGIFFNGVRLASRAESSLSIAGGALEMPAGINTHNAPPQQYATGLLAAGDSSVAFGIGSVALGRFAQAQFQDSVAIGYQAFAYGGGVAFGNNARTFAGTALGAGSYTEWGGTALGPNTHALGPYSTAIGANAYAGAWTSVGIMGWSSGGNAIAIGAWADAQDAWSAAWGRAEAATSIALGGNTYGVRSLAVNSGVTFGRYSVAIGRGTMAPQDYQVALGLLNLDWRRWTNDGSGNVSDTVHQAGDPIFVIGNGYPVNDGDPVPPNYREVRSNAFTVGYDGSTWVQGGLTVDGTALSPGADGNPALQPAPSLFKGDVSIQGVLRVPESGDLSMGAFTAGPQP